MRRAGYTLVEILAAFFLMTVLLALVMGIFVENGRQREAAIELMRERLSATGALQQIASDLESALFVARASEVDPRDHPWQFLALDSSDQGATRLRFVTQNAPRSSLAEHASTWVEVAYFLEEDRDGDLVLWRWRSSRPPSEAGRRLPDADAPGSARLAVGVSEFGVRWLDGQDEWVDEWDSAFQPPEQALPRAAEISIRLQRRAREGETDDGSIVVPGLLQTRRVALPMRPLDVASLVELGQEGGLEEEEDCYTISSCLDDGDPSWYQTLLDADCGGDEELCDVLSSPSSVCWSEIETAWPEIASRAPEVCGS
ncbi:MAG TPA: type II secretion system protein GspJ [Myxococcota bacterium]|nr:type II secretion system protein GspJ [Myxococcota bacterium]